MYGLNRLKSANHLRPLLAAVAAYPKRSLRLNPLLRPFASRHFSRRPPKPAGIDDFVKHGEIPGADRNEYERKVLPPELSRNVVKLTCDSAAHGGICDVYLVGTCHVSEKSSREVGAVIKFLQPQIVFLELCSSRRGVIDQGEDGGEFFVANTEARKYGGKVILGDRPVDITMKRAWAKTPLWEKAILFPIFLSNGIFFRSEEYCKLADRLEDWVGDIVVRTIPVVQFLFPTFVEIIVHERDQYMSAKLLEVARKHNSVVAVVGKGHLTGIRKNWKQPVHMEELVCMPTGTSTTIITPNLFYRVALIGGIIYLSIKHY